MFEMKNTFLNENVPNQTSLDDINVLYLVNLKLGECAF